MVIELLTKYCINEVIFVSSVCLSNYSLDVVVNGVTFVLIFVAVEYAYFIPLNKAILFWLFLCPSELRLFFQSLVKDFPVTACIKELLRCPFQGPFAAFLLSSEESSSESPSAPPSLSCGPCK